MSEEEKKIIESINDYIKKKEELGDLGNDFTINFRDTKPLKTLINLIDNQQKEIEEKNITINKMSKDISRQLEEIEEKSIIIMAGAEKVKQLEKGNRSLMESRIKWKNRYYKEKAKNKECISKDKIREKIKAFQDVKKEIIKNENNLSRASITYDIVRNDYCEKMLQQLLEEN